MARSVGKRFQNGNLSSILRVCRQEVWRESHAIRKRLFTSTATCSRWFSPPSTESGILHPVTQPHSEYPARVCLRNTYVKQSQRYFSNRKTALLDTKSDSSKFGQFISGISCHNQVFLNIAPTPQNSCQHFVASYSTKLSNSSTSKNPSALLVKRSMRKKIPKIHNEGKTRQLNNVVAYAIGEEIKLEPLKTILMKQGLYSIGDLPADVNNTLHVRGKYNLDQRPKEIFVFDDGSVVFWCVPEVERGAFLKVLMKYCEAPYSVALVLAEREEMDFAYVKEETSVLDDQILLQERQVEEAGGVSGGGDGPKNLLELYALSNAMGQAVKLSMWEAALETFIASIEDLTEDVRHGNRIGMSRRQVLKKSGQLLSLRHLINLSSDLLDTPDFYWNRKDLEPLYHSLCGQLDIGRRTKVINEKLTHCHELVDLVSNHLSDNHHTRLEVMIIILIFVEVAIEMFHIVENYLDSSRQAKAATQEVDVVTSSKD